MTVSPPDGYSPRSSYPTDLTDAEWHTLTPYLPTGKSRGRLRKHSVREVLDAIFYVVRGGCPWRMLPHNFPPWGTVYYWSRRWRLDGFWQRILVALCKATRQEEGTPNLPQPSWTARVFGSPRSLEASKAMTQERVFLAASVTSPQTLRTTVAREMLAGPASLMRRLELIWADGAYAGEKLRKWCEEHTGWRLEVVQRNTDSPTFEVLPRRWVVERSIAWVCRNRRLAKDYERKVQTSECWLKVAMIRLMLKRLGRK